MGLSIYSLVLSPGSSEGDDVSGNRDPCKSEGWAFPAAVFVIIPNWEDPRYPSVGEWLNTPRCTTQQLKSNKLVKHATIWMDLQGIVWSGKSQSKEVIHWRVQFA